MTGLRYECRRCQMVHLLRLLGASLAEGTCPSCKQRVQVSLERVQ